MSNDIYDWFKDLKEGQEKILAKLNDQLHGNSQSKVYDLVELQEILHVSKRTIATWLHQGILTHSKVGGKIWVTEEHLKEFLQANSTETTGNNELHNKGRRSE